MRSYLIALFVLALLSPLAVDAQPLRWVQTEGPEAATPLALASDAAGRIFAATDTRLWRSLDGGASWHSATDGLPPVAVGRVLAWRGGILASTARGIFNSSDGGESWSPVGESSRFVTPIAVDSSGAIYAAEAAGLARSTDLGATWNTRSVDPYSISALAVDRDGAILAGVVLTNSFDTRGLLLRTTDHGATWTHLPIDTTRQFITFISVTPTGTILVANADYGDAVDPGMQRSTDNGATWHTRLPEVGEAHAVTMHGGTLVTAGANGAFASTDDGESWSPLAPLGNKLWSAAFAPNGSLLVGVEHDGVARSSNGGAAWITSTEGMIDMGVTRVVAAGGTLFATTLYDRLYRSTDRGNTWTRLTLPKAYASGAPIPMPDGSIVIGAYFSDEQVVARSTDNGATWSSVDSDQIPVVVDSNGALYATPFQGGVYRSTDLGATWSGVGDPPLAFITMTAMIVLPDGTILAGAQTGRVYSLTPGQTDWQDRGSMTGGPVRAFERTSAGILYAGTMRGISRSEDDGAHWQAVSFGLDDKSVVDIESDRLGRVYVATPTRGVYISNDGFGWEPARDGLADSVANTLAVDDAGYLYVGTGWSGVYRSQSPLVSVRDESVIEGVEMEVRSASIALHVATPSEVKLELYDMLGERVLVVFEGKIEGERSFDIDREMMAAGVYLVRLEIAGRTMSRVVRAM